MAGRRSQVSVVAAACTAGLVAGVAFAYLTRPSNPKVRAAARSLVPPGAEISQDTEVTGSRFVVGDYSVSVGYRGGAPDDAGLLAAVERVAARGSWKEAAREVAPGAFLVTYERDGIEASVQVLRDRGRVGGEVDTRRKGSAQRDRRNTAAATGALVAGTVSALVLRSRHRGGPGGRSGREADRE